ncbi:uncharacterized protein LOC142550526 [Primulina tabacum]|uniref:uncharacterized protein LOC142550526 n=1 Tax=Primulina tabacum TaxID=48773 RepID=UPI003F59F432
MREEDGEFSAGSKSSIVAEELLELKQKTKVLEGQLEGRSLSRTVAKGCPFVEIIVREPLLGKFNSAKVKDYDGNADPEEHLDRWFEGLSPQSINSFKDFQKMFLHHFSSSKKYKKTAFSLFEVKQSPEESLKAYNIRFNRVALDVPTCATETKTTSFTQGLKEGEFFRSLTNKMPGDFEDLLSWAEKYINMEEAQKQKREAGRKERGDEVVKPEEIGPMKSSQGHFSRHVPLKIIRDREVQECIWDLMPSQQFIRPEKNGLCTLHGVRYHNTEDGKTLKRDYVPPSVQGRSQSNKGQECTLDVSAARTQCPGRFKECPEK